MRNKNTNMISILLFVVVVASVLNGGLCSPVPNPKSLADPQLQFQQVPSRSAQQFTMYRQLTQQQFQYPQQYSPGFPIRQSPSGQPLQPIVHYSYNITHPPRRPGIVLTHHQLQHLSYQQRQDQLQQQRLPFALQSQQRPAYSPVVLGNPNVVNLQQQQLQLQPQNIIQNSSNTANVQFQIPLQDLRERDPEDLGIGFRISNQNKKYRPDGSSSRIVFDQRPNQAILDRALQYPQKIIFGDGQGQSNQLGPLPPQAPYRPLQFNSGNILVTTTKPPIQVPYVTTLSPLQDLLQKKKSESSQAGFRSLLVSPNPGLQNSLLSTVNRNNQLIQTTRTGRVQNFVIPNFGQTPASTQLLQNQGSQQQSLGRNSNFPSNLLSNQGIQTSSFPSPGTQGTFSNQLNLNFIRGTAITPDNQKSLGQFVFADPSDPNNPHNLNSNTNINTNIGVDLNSAQKIFILPPQTAPNTGLNQNNSEDPGEIVVTVVDESTGSEFSAEDASKNSDIKEKGKVLTNFSLFITPSTYKRCFEGYRKAHDGKCRLIIKLKKRSKA